MSIKPDRFKPLYHHDHPLCPTFTPSCKFGAVTIFYSQTFHILYRVKGSGVVGILGR